MSEIAVQASFNSGEWSPHLNARVDLAKYGSGAALLLNFFVDYRGGASTRMGTKYILQCYKSATQVRVIQFQSSFNVGYLLEFGNGYIRFFFEGSPILEDPFTISAATQANPCVITVAANNFVTGDWIFIDAVVGMTQLNDKFYEVLNVAGNAVTLGTLRGANINSTGYTAYGSAGTAQRVYTVTSPYISTDDLRLIKFTQSVNQMILCHPNHVAYVLTLVQADNWTMIPAVIGSTAIAPTVTVTTTLAVGALNYSYTVTSIDANGQESSPGTPYNLLIHADIRTTAGSNEISVAPVAGAVAYNVYESNVSYFGAPPFGSEYGFIGSFKGLSFIDSNIAPDFSQTPPVSQNPFTGSGVDIVTVTVAGTYTTVPGVTFSGGSPTIPATATAVLKVIGTPTISAGGAGYVVGDVVQFASGLVMQVTTVAVGVITAWSVSSRGSITSGATPANPTPQTSTSGIGTGATASATWGVASVLVLTAGAGYTSTPTVVFSAGAAAGTATLGATSNGNPLVPGFFQQRLFLGGQAGAPQTFYLSRPGAYFNFDISLPSRADDAITGTLVSGVLNTIKSIVSTTSGMLILTDRASWLVNGGQSGSAVTPTSIVANAQSYVGTNDVPPIVANYDILYVNSKGGGVSDLAFNIYFNTFTGTNITILSSHLFYGYSIVEWAWAEYPFYMVWAVRNDGVMLTLTFLKEQDFIGWSHQTTDGTFESVAVVTEETDDAGTVDAVYTVVERDISGSIKYIERVAERVFPNGVSDAWCVDSGLQYSGAPASTFSGAEHLAGVTCTGLADGTIVPDFVMPASGNFTIAGGTYSKVTVGIGYVCDLQTLALNIGEPTVQGKVKKINNVDVRVADTLGLEIGQDFDHLTPMKDLVRGNVSSMLTGQQTQIVSDLVTGDARTMLSPAYTVPGQYCIRQSNPYPATILGVFPSFTIGDTK